MGIPAIYFPGGRLALGGILTPHPVYLRMMGMKSALLDRGVVTKPKNIVGFVSLDHVTVREIALGLGLVIARIDLGIERVYLAWHQPAANRDTHPCSGGEVLD